MPREGKVFPAVIVASKLVPWPRDVPIPSFISGSPVLSSPKVAVVSSQADLMGRGPPALGGISLANCRGGSQLEGGYRTQSIASDHQANLYFKLRTCR